MTRRTFTAAASMLLPFLRRPPAPAPAASLPLWGVVLSGGSIFRIEFHGPDDPPCTVPGSLVGIEGGGRGHFWIIPLGPIPEGVAR